MELKELKKILSDANFNKDSKDTVFEGLVILKKYSNCGVVQACEHDMIYSINVDESFLEKITEDDAIALSGLGWFVDEGRLAHFV